ncbi:MAG: hypothetical protein ACP6IY_18265 [Promethearchaeia archaeon]
MEKTRSPTSNGSKQAFTPYRSRKSEGNSACTLRSSIIGSFTVIFHLKKGQCPN